MISDYADDVFGLMTAFICELFSSSTTYITFCSRNSVGSGNRYAYRK
jgi:hypothetical protein